MRVQSLPRSNGYILYENNQIAVIATGFKRKSSNRKTGGMIQVYIIDRHHHPVEAIQKGLDVSVCLDCIHRGTDGFKERSCYVPLNGIISVFNAYKRGTYKRLHHSEYAVFTGREVRFGTYGEPCLIPLELMREIVRVCRKHSGYTHQWGRIDGEYMQYLMASVDRPNDAAIAHQMGYRTFRVEPAAGSLPIAGEVMCPSESRGTNCVDCTLCNGAVNGAKSIMITVHGVGAKHLQTKLNRLIQIAA